MKPLSIQPFTVGLALLLSASTLTAQSLPVIWQAVPFPRNSNWGGPFGSPTIITNGDLILQGQGARTKETYSVPIKVSYDVSLDQRKASDGSVDLHVLAPDQPLDVTPSTELIFRIVYSNTGDYGSVDRLEIQRYDNTGGDIVWTAIPFPVASQTVYHVEIQLAQDRTLAVSVDNQDYPVPATVTVPTSDVQLQMSGWQPINIWRVTNFNVTAPQSCTLTCGSNLVVQAAPGATSAVVNYLPPTPSDDCGAILIDCSPASGSAFPLGITTVSCRATNGTGVLASCSFTIDVLPTDSCSTIADLIDAVRSLDIDPGLRHALTSKLMAAQDSVARGNSKAARSQLHAFINQITALSKTERLDQSQADTLIQCAELIRSTLPLSVRRHK